MIVVDFVGFHRFVSGEQARTRFPVDELSPVCVSLLFAFSGFHTMSKKPGSFLRPESRSMTLR